jgi:hypothetical protein
MRGEQVVETLTRLCIRQFKQTARARELCAMRQRCGKKLHSTPPAGGNRSKAGPNSEHSELAARAQPISSPRQAISRRVLQKPEFLSYIPFLIYFFLRAMLKEIDYRVMDKGFRSWLLRRPFVP